MPLTAWICQIAISGKIQSEEKLKQTVIIISRSHLLLP